MDSAVEPSPPSEAAQTDPNALFRKFDNYPWVKDRQFLQGLAAMLGPLVPSTDMDRASGISLQARIWWFQGKLGEQIDPVGYGAYRSSLSDSSSPCPDTAVLARIEDIQRRLGIVGGAGAVPSWQVHAPRADLGVKAADGVSREGGGGGGDGAGEGDAPYPEQFRAVIEAVTLGKPVPGVREIPNTVVRVPGITPVGKMQAPRKPWEKGPVAASSDAGQAPVHGEERGGEGDDEGSSASSGLAPGVLDQEFPPVADDEGLEKGAAEEVARVNAQDGSTQ